LFVDIIMTEENHQLSARNLILHLAMYRNHDL